MKFVLKLIAILAFTVPAFAADSRCAASVADAERAFARMASEKGIQPAFVFNLTEDSVIFRPTAIAGKKWYVDHPGVPGVLSWDPALVECSCDLAYSTGPWEYREKAGEEPLAYGNFVSMWRLQKDGSWKVALDFGNENPKPQHPHTPFSAGVDSPAAPSSKPDLERVVLLKSDQKLSLASALAEKAILLRKDIEPVVDHQAILDHLKGEKLSWSPEKAEISSCGDLGYTYGTAEGPDFKGVYLRIWRKLHGDWKVVMDALSPLPDSPQSHEENKKTN